MENNTNNYIPVPGRLTPISKDRVIAGTDVIYDDALGKTQAEINVGIEETVAEKVEQSIRESPAVSDIVDAKISQKVSGAVTQALNEVGVSAMQETIGGIQERLDSLSDNNTTYRLSVNGTIKGDTGGVDLGSVYAPIVPGTSGQLLSSAGEGNAPQWVNAPSGGISGITAEEAAAIVNQALYGSNDKPQGATPVTTENLNSTLSGYLKTGDMATWAKGANKPSYNYEEIGYNISKVSSEGGAVALDATVPVHEITASANISGIIFANNTVPEDGHSCHVIVKAAEALSVSIADGATMATVGGTSYLSVCPESNDITLNITAGGYVEFDLFRIGENIYIRGI